MKSFKSEYKEIDIFKFGNLSKKNSKFTSYIYHIDGLLIDTGHSKASKQVLKRLKNIKVDQIFITHHHEDHSGNIKLLQQYFKCPVYSSELCSNIMKNPPKLSLAQKGIWGNRPPYQNIIPIYDTIKTEHYQFQILSIPGHAIDMAALYEPNKKWLFSADLYINSYIGYYLKNESILQQIDSIKKVLELDFDVLLCSHNPQFKNGKEKLIKKLNYLQSFYDEVTQYYKKGFNAKQIMSHMNLKEFKLIKVVSGGDLARINMVKSAIRDYNQINNPINQKFT